MNLMTPVSSSDGPNIRADSVCVVINQAHTTNLSTTLSYIVLIDEYGINP